MSKKIMVVDDSPNIRKAIKLVLESEGFEVETARDGPECLKKLKQNCPDLILLDIIMPRNGVHVLKDIMKLGLKSKVAMLTVVGRNSTVEECRRLGAEDFIAKPFDNRELVRRVKQLVGEKTRG